MSKEVYLKMGERNKLIKFRSQAGKSDAQCLRDAMVEASVLDINLRTRLEGCIPIFQRFKKKKTSQEVILVDLEETEEIEDEADLSVLFCPIVPLCEDQSVPIICDFQETPDGDLLSGGDFVEKLSEGVDTPNIISIEENPKEDVMHDIKSLSTNSQSTPETIEDQILSSSNSKYSKSSSLSKKKNPKTSQKISLPALTEQLRAFIGKANLIPEKFIAHYGSALRESCKDSVTKISYSDYADAITTRHPELLDADNKSSTIVRSSLSMFVRNGRRREKEQQKKLLELSGEELQAPPSKRPRKEKGMILGSSSSHPDNSDEDTPAHIAQMEKMVCLLKKTAANVGATNTVIRLVKDSFQFRRKWILSVPVASGPSFITEEYPHLKHADLILLELSLLKNREIHIMEADLHESLQEVAQFSELKFDSEEQLADCLETLYNRYKPRNTPKDTPNCISVKETNDPLLRDLNSKENEGARLVLFFDKDNTEGSSQLSVAFIVADQSIKIKIEQPTVIKSLLCLLACYHVWDKTFPPAYKCFLSIFDALGLRTESRDINIRFKAFRRDFKIWKDKQTAKLSKDVTDCNESG